jgi:hypothetical protein
VQLGRGGSGWGWGTNQATSHYVFSHCVAFHHRLNSGTLRPSDDDSFMFLCYLGCWATYAPWKRRPAPGGPQLPASCSELYMNAANGRGGLLRGLLEQMQHLLSSTRTRYYFPKLTANLSIGRRLGYWHSDTSDIVTAMGRRRQHTAQSKASWDVWNIQALIVLIAAFSTHPNLSVCVGSRAQTLHAVVPRGLSASLEVEGEWPGPGLMSCGEFCRAHLFGAVAAHIGIGSAQPGPGPRRRQ